MKEAPQSVLRGIWLVAIGRPEGIGCFRGTMLAFAQSLVPMLSFSLIAVGLLQQRGDRHDALVQLIAAPVSALSGPIAAHFVAVRLKREANWARFATASNWCQWGYLTLLLIALAIWSSGVAIAPLILLGVLIYAIWIQLFLARHALALNWPRAAWVVIAVAAANFVFVLAPGLVADLIARGGK